MLKAINTVKFFLLYWSTVDLQCCANFYCTPKWFRSLSLYIHTYIYICSLKYSFPYGLWQDSGYHSLCSMVGPCCLLLLDKIACSESQTLSPSLPHLLFPLATTGLFSMSVSLLPVCIKAHLCHILDSTCMQCHMIFAFLFLTFFT